MISRHEKYRDHAQKNLALTTMLRVAGLGHLWTEFGPTQAGKVIAQNLDIPISKHERTLFLAALDLHEHSKVVLVGDALEMPGHYQDALFGLVKAALNGPDRIDAWIRRTSIQVRLAFGPTAAAARD